MKRIIQSTAILGGASVINILIGLISSKITAILLGPGGFGLMSLYQSVINLAMMVASLGLPTALTRAMARSVSDKDATRTAEFRRAGWSITIIATLIAISGILAFRSQLNGLLSSTQRGNGWILFIAAAILFSMMANTQIAIINSRHRVGDLARISVLSAALSLIPTIALVWTLGTTGVAPALAAGTLVNALVSSLFYRRATRQDAPFAAGILAVPVKAARELIGFGLPFMASLAVGNGVVTLIPILVLHALGPVQVGLFRAASAIAVNYLSVILNAMAQDYFPRLSQTQGGTRELHGIVNDQLRFILLVAGPVILAMIGAVPYLVPLLYSKAFVSAADMLEWQLIGDLFKFATWAMGFVIMVKLGSRIFFLTELASGLVLLASSWFGMRWLGLPGLGVAFLVTGIFACAANWLVLYRSSGITWRPDNILLFLLLVLAAAMLRLMIAIADMPLVNLFAAALLASGFGTYSLVVISREFGGVQAFLAKRRRAGN